MHFILEVDIVVHDSLSRSSIMNNIYNPSCKSIMNPFERSSILDIVIC
jgi:hypothetical protein